VFFQTYFDLALRARQINTIIVSGCHTETGVAATVFGARDLDYNTIVVSDACGTIHDQRAHDLFIELVFPRMSRIRTTAQILEMIEKAEDTTISPFA
jgi:nicotinamidase-related amidase